MFNAYVILITEVICSLYEFKIIKDFMDKRKPFLITEMKIGTLNFLFVKSTKPFSKEKGRWMVPERIPYPLSSVDYIASPLPQWLPIINEVYKIKQSFIYVRNDRNKVLYLTENPL